MVNTQPSVHKVPLILLIISGLFFYFNFAIGDTILGNVIALFVSFVFGCLSLIIAASLIKSTDKKVLLRAIMIGSGAIITSICFMLIFDGLPMGYGP